MFLGQSYNYTIHITNLYGKTKIMISNPNPEWTRQRWDWGWQTPRKMPETTRKKWWKHKAQDEQERRAV